MLTGNHFSINSALLHEQENKNYIKPSEKKEKSMSRIGLLSAFNKILILMNDYNSTRGSGNH